MRLGNVLAVAALCGCASVGEREDAAAYHNAKCLEDAPAYLRDAVFDLGDSLDWSNEKAERVHCEFNGLGKLDVDDPSEVERLTTELRMARCEKVVTLAVGVVGGNRSHGGYCRAEDGSFSGLVCTDEMVGYYERDATASQDVTRYDVAAFIADNCTGG